MADRTPGEVRARARALDAAVEAELAGTMRKFVVLLGAALCECQHSFGPKCKADLLGKVPAFEYTKEAVSGIGEDGICWSGGWYVDVVHLIERCSVAEPKRASCLAPRSSKLATDRVAGTPV